MTRGVCVVVGAGPGNGAAIAARFSIEGYKVAICARNLEGLRAIAASVEGCRSYCYDVRDCTAAERVFGQIRNELGPVTVLVYNAGAGAFANVDGATLEDFQAAWEVNARGLFLAAQQVLGDMRECHGGNIVVIGATASLRGGANFLPFASAKAAQRSLAQSLAKHLGPEKIHVSYVVIDGVIDLERTRSRFVDKADDFFLDPAQIAESVYFLTQQRAQAWTFELDLRPFAEKW